MFIIYNLKNTYKRENWKEVFRIFVLNILLDNGVKLPRGFIKTYESIDKDGFVFWKWYLYPFIKIGLFVRKWWFKIGRWFYKKGYLGERNKE